MSTSAQAARARIFMQRCRTPVPSSTNSSNLQRSASSYSDASRFDPSNYGKKIRLSDVADTSVPLPAWRQSNADYKQTTPSPTSIASTPSDTPATTLSEQLSTPKTFDLPNRARNAPVPRYRHNPAASTGFIGFLKYSVFRLREPPNPHDSIQPSFNVLTNPYHARKPWPPILTDLPEIHQFHYEKKFRRRLLLKVKNGRRTWDNGALFLRRFGVGFLIFYFALVAEPPGDDTRVPPDGLRYWMYGKFRGLEGVVPESWSRWNEEMYQFYRRKYKRQWDPYNHEGWDESRGRNTLPGQATPTPNAKLGEPGK